MQNKYKIREQALTIMQLSLQREVEVVAIPLTSTQLQNKRIIYIDNDDLLQSRIHVPAKTGNLRYNTNHLRIK